MLKKNILKSINDGIKYQSKGYLKEALLKYEEVLRIDKQNFDALHLTGIILYQLKKYDNALYFIEKAIELKKIAEIYCNKGMILKAMSRLDEALTCYNEALRLKNNYIEAYYNKANLLKERGFFHEAINNYNLALEINKNIPEAYVNRGVAMQELKLYEEAIESYNFAIKYKVEYSEAYANRGVAQNSLRKYSDALESYDLALKYNPNFSEVYSNRGVILKELGKLKEAVISYDRSIELNTDLFEAYTNRGNALEELRELYQAAESHIKAIKINPNYYLTYSNLGSVLQELMQINDAIKNYDKSISLNPDYIDAYWNKSLALLLLGNFVDGFMMYEKRWLKEEFIKFKKNIKKPRWNGKESLKGKTIYIHSEQGLGDTLQFSRYIKILNSKGCRIIFAVQKPLIKILEFLEGDFELISFDIEYEEFDYYCPLMSLPYILETKIHSIPSNCPYIKIDQNLIDKWNKFIGCQDFKIAICWQGSPNGKVDLGRSFPLILLQKISKIKGLRLISIQKNHGVEQIQTIPFDMKVETLPNYFDDTDNSFLDTAAVMMSVDLVISSDTAVAHLAGALGVKTWMPLKYVPDWRWMLDRRDSPWYPNHTLFRQKKLDHWGDVFYSIENELIHLMNNEINKNEC